MLKIVAIVIGMLAVGSVAQGQAKKFISDAEMAQIESKQTNSFAYFTVSHPLTGEHFSQCIKQNVSVEEANNNQIRDSEKNGEVCASERKSAMFMASGCKNPKNGVESFFAAFDTLLKCENARANLIKASK